MAALDTYHVVLYGGSAVGKTSSVVQLRENRYTILDASWANEDTHYTEIEVDGERSVLVILDTASSPNLYSADREQFIKSADGYVLMFSIDVAQTFQQIPSFREEINNLRSGETTSFPTLLAGNKNDLDLVREVSQKDAHDLAASFGGIPYVELTSKDHASVQNMWASMIREIRKHKKNPLDKRRAKK